VSFSLIQLSHFTETARAGSMTLAAQRLHLSQPALSSSINQLEKELGIDLLERIPRRGVRLTRAGRLFFEDAVLLLARAHAMKESVTEHASGLGGHLRLGMYQPIAPFRAPLILQAFTQQHPEVTVELVEADQEELARMLADRDVDVVVSYAMVPFHGMHSELLEMVRPHAIVPATHHLAESTAPVSLSELAADPLILLDLPYTGAYYLSLFRSADIEPTVRFRVNGYETVRGLVARGFGISILNQRIHLDRTYSGERVHTVEISGDLESLPVHLVVHPEDLSSPAIAAFIELYRRLISTD
jgi:DNA-binding transcriptional LysR family regulator